VTLPVGTLTPPGILVAILRCCVGTLFWRTDSTPLPFRLHYYPTPDEKGFDISYDLFTDLRTSDDNRPDRVVLTVA